MTIALVANTGAGSGDGNSVTTSGIDTTGATLIVLAVNAFADPAGSGTLSDSKGNTWTGLTTYNSFSALFIRLYYCASPTVGSGHTFTWASTGQNPGICVQAYSGAATSSPLDQQSGASGDNQPGSVTPSENNEVLVTALTIFGSVSSVDSGFTISDSFVGTAFATDMGIAYKIQTTAGAENVTWNGGAGESTSACNIATFKAAAAAGGSNIHVLAAVMQAQGNQYLGGGIC